MSEEKKVYFDKKRIALIGSIVVSVFFVLLILGKPYLFPFPSRVLFDGPIAASFGDEASVVADQAGDRLLFLDRERKLKRIAKLGDDTEINTVSCFADDGKHFFVAGYDYIQDTDIYSSFKIIRMDHNGRNPVTVLEYVNEDGMETNYVMSITAYNGCLYITRSDGDIIVTKYQIESGKTQDILTTRIPSDYTARYNPKAEILYVNDYYGRTFTVSNEHPEPVQILEDYLVENYLPLEDGRLIWLDSISKNLYENDRLLLENTNAYFSIFPCKEGIIFDDATDSRLSILNLETKAVSPLYYAAFSGSYMLFSLCCTLSILYLCILFVVLNVKMLRNIFITKNYVLFKRAGIAIVMFVSVCFITLMYTNKIIDIENQNLKAEIRLYSHYFAENIDQKTLEDAVYTPEVGKNPKAWENYLTASEKLEKEFGFFRERLDENRSNGYLAIFKKQGDKLITVFESSSISHFGYQFHYSDFASLIESDDVEIYQKLGYNEYHSMIPITDSEGETIGILEYGQDYRLTNEKIKTICINMIVELLSVFATAYIIVVEIIEFIKNRKKRKELIRQGTHKHPEITMIRNAMFLFISTDFVDSVVSVYIAKQLLLADGIKETSFLLALPSLMMGIGIATTCFAFNLIAPHVYIKRIAMTAGITYVLVRAGTCVSILLGSYVLYCLMKLFAEFALGYLYCIIQTMRVKADNEEERYYTSRQFSVGRLGGAMMGALISGFVVQDISQSVILYLISAVIGIPLILMLNRILPEKTFYVTPSGDKNTMPFGKKLAFLFDRSILVYFLFALIPMYLIIGYQGYLFPLFAGDAKMNAMYVTTAVVMSRALLFLLSDSFENILKKINPWKTTIFTIGLIGIAFLEFSINSSIIWSIIMLVIAGMSEFVVMPASEVLWTRRARALGIPLESITSNMALIDEIFCAFKETMLSVFLLLGNNPACIALGAFCIVTILIFMLYSRKKDMALAA